MISLVIPFYNEERILADTVLGTQRFLEDAFGDYELVLVDDGSVDGSLQVARRFQGDRVQVLTHNPNRGKGYSVRQGMLAARGDMLFFCDTDLAYGLEVLLEGVKRLESGTCDIIAGSRAIHPLGYARYPLLRRIASRGFVLAANAIAGLRSSDCQCGFKGFTREAARRIFSRTQIDGFAFDMEVLGLAKEFGFRIEEMPVAVLVHGASTVRVGKDSLIMLKDALAARLARNRIGRD